jgi:threonine dehydrogenase-like Zn-dependent dehydrogenase
VPDPPAADGSLLVRARQLGLCGTDFELIAGHYGWPPDHSHHLILGHESLGEVEQAPADSDFVPGDWVIGIVRRPDPEPCPACAAGEWDMCRNGRYTERGIKQKHGFGAERWRIEPEYAIKVEPGLRDVAILVEPASVLAKAWEHIEHIAKRAYWRPRSLLVTGAGPIGLFAALMGHQRGLDVHVLDQMSDGPKPQLVQALGGKYYSGSVQQLGFSPDIVIECSGAAEVIRDSLLALANGGIFCMVGSSSHPQNEMLNVIQLNRRLVLGNAVVFGVVNANRRHYEQAAEVVRRAERSWLQGVITRREPLTSWRSAFQRRPGDVKVVLDFS